MYGHMDTPHNTQPTARSSKAARPTIAAAATASALLRGAGIIMSTSHGSFNHESEAEAGAGKGEVETESSGDDAVKVVKVTISI